MTKLRIPFAAVAVGVYVISAAVCARYAYQQVRSAPEVTVRLTSAPAHSPAAAKPATGQAPRTWGKPNAWAIAPPLLLLLVPWPISYSFLRHARALASPSRESIEQHRAALHRSENRYRKLIETMTQGVVCQDSDGVITAVNPAAERILGIERSDLVGRACDDRRWQATREDGSPLPAEEHPAMLALRTGQPVRDTVMGVHDPRTGSQRWVLVDAVPECAAGETRPSHVRSTFTDVTKRKRAEQELDRFFALSQDVLCVAGMDGYFKRVNPAFERMLGYSREELLSRPYLEFVHPDDREATRRQADGCATGRSVDRFENRYRCKDGSYRWLMWTSTAPGAEGVVYATAHDVTDHKRAIEALRESEERFRSLVEATSDWIWEVDAECVYTYASPKVKDLLGYEPDEVVGKSPLDLMLPKEARRVGEVWQRLRRENAPFVRVENWNVHKDGRMVLLETSGVPTFDTAGNLIGYRGIDRDVTDRVRAAETLQQREATLQSIFRAAPTGIGLVCGRVLQRANERLCEITGYSSEELIGRTARILYATDEDYEYVGREKYAWIGEKGTGTVETRWQRKDGTIIDVLLSSTPIDPADLSAGVTFTALDITERKRAEAEHVRLEAQLRQAQKMEAIGQLAGGIAHDFNNILTAIYGNVELALKQLRAEHPGANRLLDELEQIERGAERATTLTRQLLAFSRRQVSQPQVLDLNAAIGSMEGMLRRLITEHISLDIRLSPDLANVCVDPGHMEQVIMNLVVNACDAMPEGGTLLLETSNVHLDEVYVAKHPETTTGPHVLLVMADTGCGMDAATMERIFEPFFTTKKVGQGTGLGLATVYGIIKQARGHIAVYSERGHGTTFRVYLPASQAGPEAQRTLPDDDRANAGSETVLVCEDDETVRHLTVTLLEGAGYAVLAAENGEQAVRLAGDYPGDIHLLVTDVIMPDMNGKKLADALRSRRRALKTLYVSGYTANVIAHHGVLDEGVEFLEKPFTRQQLLRRVRETLDARLGNADRA